MLYQAQMWLIIAHYVAILYADDIWLGCGQALFFVSYVYAVC